MAITASACAPSANFFAASGISNAPGTYRISICFFFAPADCNAANAPLSSCSVIKPLKRLTKTNATIQQGVAGAERVFELLDTVPEVVDRPTARPLTAMRRGITFEHVGFTYGNDLVLRDINLEIHAGEVVALVGMSGGGKSTLADLIPRFYDVTEGRITIDGVDLRDYTLRSLRAQIALVTQFTFLFNDTVRANIAYGDIGKSMEDVVSAARRVLNA